MITKCESRDDCDMRRNHCRERKGHDERRRLKVKERGVSETLMIETKSVRQMEDVEGGAGENRGSSR